MNNSQQVFQSQVNSCDSNESVNADDVINILLASDIHLGNFDKITSFLSTYQVFLSQDTKKTTNYVARTHSTPLKKFSKSL